MTTMMCWLMLGLATVSVASGQVYRVTGTHTLPRIALSEFLLDNGIRKTPGQPVDDHGIFLGGIGSDLWRSPEDGPNVYWMITDRGPNGQIGTPARRTFPVPEFTPFILKVRARNGRIEILQSIPLTGVRPRSVPATGLSNSTHDEVPYGCSATDASLLSYNPHGLDTEGLVRTSKGKFWMVEEYSTSILVASAKGRIEKRYIPIGLTPPAPTVDYLSVPALPAIFANRRGNRGFEGIAISPDERIVYAALQSPINNPGNASLNTRILAFDTKTERPVAEYVYRFQAPVEFPENSAGEIKISGLAMIDANRMMVLERTDLLAKIYIVDLRKATNILDSPYDRTNATPTLESLDAAGLAAANVAPLEKTLLINMDSTATGSPFPSKIEGLAIVNDSTIAVANDNDFGVGAFDITPGACVLKDTNNPTRLLTIEFSRSFRAGN